jgi:hypothetical protein
MFLRRTYRDRERVITLFVIALLFVITFGLGLAVGYAVFGASSPEGKSASNTDSNTESKAPAAKPKESLPKIKMPAMHTGLRQSSDPQLRLLARHEQSLNRGFSANMIFADMPTTRAAAEAQAARLAPILKEHARYGIEPLVAFEPERADLRSLNKAVFTRLFAQLKTLGITSESMGAWLPLPEPNIPEWGAPGDIGNTDPKLFAKNYTMIASELKKVFPAAETVLLLDSATYPVHDVNYTSGSYATDKLLKYVDGVPTRLIDAVGLQGFPWGERGIELKYDPARFLNAQPLIALARKAGTKNAWFNTGTFKSMYDWRPDLRVTVSATQRKEILAGIAAQVTKTQKAGLFVTVNIFAENKASTEADWSYGDTASKTVFKTFVTDMSKQGIGLTLFDSPK